MSWNWGKPSVSASGIRYRMNWLPSTFDFIGLETDPAGMTMERPSPSGILLPVAPWICVRPLGAPVGANRSPTGLADPLPVAVHPRDQCQRRDRDDHAPQCRELQHSFQSFQRPFDKY